jgi:hypothetical protein
MFLRISILFASAIAYSAAVAAESNGVQLLTHQVIVERVARQVFVGADRDMPKGGQYRLAIQPTLSETGHVVIPTSIISALKEMRNALPRWYLDALKASAGDTECMVVVDNFSYGALVSSWMEVTWVTPESPLWNEFKVLGADVVGSPLSIGNTLSNGMCELVKTDDEAHTMEYVARVAKFRLTQ